MLSLENGKDQGKADRKQTDFFSKSRLCNTSNYVRISRNVLALNKPYLITGNKFNVTL